MGIHPAALLVLYGGVALAPLAIAALTDPRENDFLAELGIGLGLMAYAMLLMQFVSSGRFEQLSGRVGIDRMMRFHQLTARLLAVLVILHPLAPRIPTSMDMLSMTPQTVAIMFGAPHMRSGVVAWAILLIVVLMAIFRHHLPLRYEAWRATHVLGALVVAAGGAHHTFTVGSYSGQSALFWFWCALLVVAITSFLFVYFVRPWLLWRMGYRVVANRVLAPGIRELTMEPGSGRGIRFEPGQFAWLNTWPLPLLDHPFSICSAPAELPRVRMLIKARGDFSANLERLVPGTPVRLDAPHGHFGLHAGRGDSVYLIAGGIGISPVMGVLRHLHATRDRRPISLLYGARNREQLVYADEISAIAAEINLKTRFFLDEPPPGWSGGVGPITEESVRAGLPGAPQSCLCLICGPTPLMLAAERHLLAAGVPSRQIVYERFEYD
jgi:predicted ferric reductase